MPKTPLAARNRRRDEILRAAAGLFASDGYASTSMREVAAASGILPGSLYHHFESKEAIAVELVEEYHADLVRVVRESQPDPDDPLASLYTFARDIANVSWGHQAALAISVFDAPGTASSSLRTVVRTEPASVDRYWRRLISAAVAAEVIEPSVDGRILRHVLNRTIVGVGLAWDHAIESNAVTDCILALLFEGLASSADACEDKSKPARIVDEARVRWADQAAGELTQRRGQILDAARTEFAQRGFDATTVRDIADAAGVKASNLYRYFESKDSMIREILGNFSEQLLAAYRDVIGAGSGTVQTVDAILWLLNQAGRHFSREVEILQTFSRLMTLGVADTYHEGAEARLTLLSELIARGVASGELNQIADPALVASCLREIMWAPMRNLVHISPQRVRQFHRQSVLSGLARSSVPR
ncbi:MAG: TetR/AcrR family transcriptional regulator [Actinobacteria bacterium]|nr:TetR/AcrR family transcriptional regulator [Actinomycetota bacterium]